MDKKSDTFLTPNQATQILNVSLSTLKKFIYQGKIKTLKTPGGHHRIRQSDLFAMVGVGLKLAPPSLFGSKSVFEISKGFIAVLERRQKFCQGHANSVAEISLKIAQGLEFSTKQMNGLHLAALLHDMGMIDISEDILNKPAPLSHKEYSIIKTHPLLGEKITNSITQFKELSSIIRQHHERFDGRGYPDSLMKKEICQEAGIIAVADAFEVMTSINSYKKTLSTEEALGEIERNAGTQFDPRIAQVLLEIYKKGE